MQYPKAMTAFQAYVHTGTISRDERAARSFRGFSLTELLVALAVIAIIAVILFPVLDVVRNSSHQAACASNLRQIGSTFSIYALEYNGKLPPCMQRRSPESGLFNPWPRYLTRVMPEFTGELQNQWWRSDIFVCPATGDVRSYGMNWAAGGVTVANIEDASRKVLAADSALGQGDWSLALYPVWPDDKHQLDFRHGGRANFLFFDGHVEARDNDEIYEWDKPGTWRIEQ